VAGVEGGQDWIGPHVSHLRLWLTPVHENGKLSHSLSKQGLRVRILEERILPVSVLVVMVDQIRYMVVINSVILEGRRVAWILCERLMGLTGESHRQRQRRREMGIGTVNMVRGMVAAS